MSAATASAHAHAHPCAAPCVLYVSECVLPTFGLSLTRQDICGLLEALSYGMTSAATYRVGGEAAECLQEAVVEMMAWGARRIFPSVISVQDAKIVARADLRCDVIGAPGEKALCVRSSDPFLAGGRLRGHAGVHGNQAHPMRGAAQVCSRLAPRLQFRRS